MHSTALLLTYRNSVSSVDLPSLAMDRAYTSSLSGNYSPNTLCRILCERVRR